MTMRHKITDDIANDWKEHAYYDLAESDAWLQGFWVPGRFYDLFCRLDPTRIVEVACGHGRHVPKYADKSEEITLVDINRENIDFCRERFKDKKNVRYVVNDGSSLQPVGDSTQTAVFSYDAMVHFELFDIFGYLVETCRVLQPGGMALFHHSNYTGNPGAIYKDNPHGRNFMSAGLFTHLAMRAGLEVVAQNLLHWTNARNLDCLSLCKKPRETP